MKLFTKKATIAFLIMLLPMLMFAHVLEKADYKPGFFGHPLLKSTGYKAESGQFNIEVGQSLQDIENMTDDEYSNYTTAVSILGATVAYDERVRVVPEDITKVKPIAPGKSVGFVVSPGSNDVSVLNLSVAKVVAINLLDKNGEIIKSLASEGDDNFNVLNLNLVNVAIDGMVKVAAQIPLDIDREVYGVSLSTGGVDANVGHNLKIHYAFIDDFEMVPIIKKYYPNATGEVSGMATGGKKLVNNNLEDGAATAILTLGGTYYTVMTNSRDANGNLVPFPHGVEAGWVMSSGTALSLEAGGAIQIIGIRTDGSEYIISTNVNVVGLNLLGGGDTVIPFMTPIDPEIDLIGFKLNRINVLDLDLGATLVNYAYIKVPESLVPPLDAPFEARIEAVPKSSVPATDNAGDGIYTPVVNPYIKNKYENIIYVGNYYVNDLIEKPLIGPDDMTSTDRDRVWRKQNAYINRPWVTYDFQGFRLVLSRRDITEANNANEEVVAWYDIVKTGGYVGGSAYAKENTYYYRYNKGKSASGSDWTEYKPNEKGELDLSELIFDESDFKSKNEYMINKDGSADDEGNVIGFEYRLYFENGGDIKDTNESTPRLEDCTELDYSDVVVPNYTVKWELAGTVNNIDENNDIYNHNNEVQNAQTGADGPWSNVDLATNDKYRHYVTFNVPDKIDHRSTISGVKLYRYYYTGQQLRRSVVDEYTYSLDDEGHTVWTSKNNNLLGYVHMNGITKIVPFVKNSNETDEYGIELSFTLNQEYIDEVVKYYNANASNMTPAKNPLDYGWYWTGAPEGYTLPKLELKKENISSTSYLGPNQDQTVVTAKWDIDLGDDCKVGHLPQITNGWYNHPETNIYNIDILFNQWSTLRYDDTETKVKATKTGKMRALLDGYVETTDQNVVLNVAEAEGNEIDGQYDVENVATSDYIMTSQVTYPNDMIYRPSTQYQVTTRAYVPVVPDGFQTKGLSDDVQTYLALEKTETVLIYDISTTGLENVVSDDAYAPAEYYNLQGVRVERSLPGIYIVRRGKKVTKEYIF